MQNQNKSVMNIDDREKGRKGIEEMLVRMSKMSDAPDKPKFDEKHKETA